MRVKVGLRKACTSFPMSVVAINSFAKRLAPTAVWTSLVLLERSITSEHRDTANAALPNILIPVSRFEAGELCVERPEALRSVWMWRRGQ